MLPLKAMYQWAHNLTQYIRLSGILIGDMENGFSIENYMMELML